MIEPWKYIPSKVPAYTVNIEADNVDRNEI